MNIANVRHDGDPPTMPAPVTVGGLPITPLSRTGWAQLMVDVCLHARRRPGTPPFVVISANGQVLALAHRDAGFRAILDKAGAIDADGQPLVHASRIFARAPLPERCATTDLFHDAADAAAASGLSFYFLGATAENVGRAVAAVRAQHPRLAIAGFRNGYFGESEEAQICSDIVDAGTDVLWVGLGVPRQEAFVARNREALRGVGWIKTCGGLFDHMQPGSRRAPPWMQSAGLEWAFRAAREPRKLLWRYLTTNGTALWLLATRTG
jgi:exopolysaccharide biosynthesis WecB/TagA/CpsF family protein